MTAGVTHGVTNTTGIGAPVPRVEDRRLLTGAGQYSDDMNRPDQVYAVMVRSEQAHAMLHRVTAGIAGSMPGVLAILSGQHWLDDGLNPMPAWGNPKDVELKNHDGREIFYTPLYPVAIDRIRRVGEIVAMVALGQNAGPPKAKQAALDEAALEADEPFRLTNIPGGCVCCTAPEGFVDALGAVLAEHPDRLIVEPTGLARPQDLIDTIRRCPHRDALELAPVVVLIDPHQLAVLSGGSDDSSLSLLRELSGWVRFEPSR